MAATSVYDIVTLCQDVTSTAVATIAAAVPALESGTASSTDLSNIVASLTGSRGDIVAARADLDSTYLPDLFIHQDAQRVIQLWGWERDVRHALVMTDDALRAAVETATTVLAGQKKKTRTLRSGETLQAIAQQELGDWREWPRIVAASGLDITKGNLDVGTILTIPEKG